MSDDPLTESLRFAYADPPYVGCSHRYPEHPDAARWDDPTEHVKLMHQLDTEFDGWALSLHEPSLKALLTGAPDGTRVAAWVKPWCTWKPTVRIAYSWEPVLWKRTAPRRTEPRGRDHLRATVAFDQSTIGAKPEVFARWLLLLLGWQAGDEFHDLFPGTGVIGRVAAENRLPV